MPFVDFFVPAKMKRSATERAKDTPCASWHVSAFGVVGFHVPRGSAAGMCLFLFPAANREHTTGKEKFFSYGACNLATGSLYYRQLHPGEMGSEDFDVFSVWSVRNLETSA